MNSLFKIITNNATNTDIQIQRQSIIIRDLELMMSIGVYDQEKTAKQRVILNIELNIDENRNPQSDNINEVICYASVITAIEELTETKHFELVETLAHDVATTCLHMGEQAQSVTVNVMKPDIHDKADVGFTLTAAK